MGLAWILIMQIDKRFDNHKVISYTPNTIVYRNPDSGFDAMRFDIIGNYLVVTGDIDEAMYCFGKPVNGLTFEWLASLDAGYFWKKCVASQGGRCPRRWDASSLAAKLNKNLETLSDEAVRTSEDPVKEIADLEDYHRVVSDYIYSYEEFIIGNENYYEEFNVMFNGDVNTDLAFIEDPICELHLTALQLAVQEIKKTQNVNPDPGTEGFWKQ